jgi:hypothetical protein
MKGLMPYAMACYIHRRRGDEVRTAGFAGGIHPKQYGTDWLAADGVEIIEGLRFLAKMIRRLRA